MNNADFEALARVLMGRVFIELEASGRHVHVTKEQALALFGQPFLPDLIAVLSQPFPQGCNPRSLAALLFSPPFHGV